jgi:hypothetical protein
VAAPVVGGALLAAWFAAPRLAAASACRALRPAAPAVLLLVLLVALAAGEPAKQRRTDAALFATTVEGCAVGDAWHQLEKLPAGSRVAYFGHFAYKYYPTFGREFDLLPAGLERDGSPYVHLHLEWRDKGTTLWALQERHGDLDCLLKNLEAAEVDYVLVTKCGEESWPPHRALLASWPGVQPIYDDGCSALWKIKMTSSRREHRSDSSTSN